MNMTISKCYQQGETLLSFEVFPPKKEQDIQNIEQLLSSLSALRPGFISVTCGAGGSSIAGGISKTTQIADLIARKYATPSLAHLTCVSATRADISRTLREMQGLGIENVLALRGDLPSDMDAPLDYPYAEQLILDIRRLAPEMCIGAACYPEGHIDCESAALDLSHLKRKQDAGADFLVSQLFFENELFYRFLDRARAAGIHLPISAGVMPMLSRSQVERMIYMCGASLPSQLIKLLHRFGDNPSDLRKAGIDYAAQQAHDLVQQGVDGVHIYTMNHTDIAQTCADRVRAG